MSAMLDPQLQRYFEETAALFPPLPSDPTPLMRRSRYWTVCALGRTALPPTVTMNDVALALPVGSVRVRLFYGHDGSDEAVPTIVFFHGGGWVVGDVETHTVTCARMAHEANALVCAIDYPLAPEADWHTITEACYQAAKAIADDRNAQTSGTPIALVGDSAGAHLSAVTALRVRDENAFHIALQGLLYPCIEPQFNTPSYDAFAMGPGLTKTDMQWYWRHFAGNDINCSDYRIAPTRATSLAGLPPAYLVTAGCDPLRDDGRAYMHALQAHDVHVTHDEFDCLPHGFLRMAKYSEATDQAIARINHRLGQLLRQSQT